MLASELCVVSNWFVLSDRSSSGTKRALIKLPLIEGENLMEYAQDLIKDKKTALRECHLQALFAQLFVALHSLHRRGLVHHNIKIENVEFQTSSFNLVLFM